MDIVVTAEAAVNPTEDQSKVERALRSIFPEGPIRTIGTEGKHTVLRFQGNGFSVLSNLRNLIRQERIRSAARSVIFSRTEGRRIRIYLNKQAAFVGRVSFCEPVGESPNGPISIEIEASDAQSVVDFLANPGPAFSQEFAGRRRR
jgi:predicted RNA binding protein with dsRBD fold (UPF0201 family)